MINLSRYRVMLSCKACPSEEAHPHIGHIALFRQRLHRTFADIIQRIGIETYPFALVGCLAGGLHIGHDEPIYAAYPLYRQRKFSGRNRRNRSDKLRLNTHLGNIECAPFDTAHGLDLHIRRPCSLFERTACHLFLYDTGLLPVEKRLGYLSGHLCERSISLFLHIHESRYIIVAVYVHNLRDIARLAKSQQLSQEEGINLAGIARILSLEEENRELRRQVERLRKPAGSSVFAADTDGDIVEIERSRRARMWRRQIQVNARQLPSRESLESARVTADAYDTPNGGVARENKGVQRGKPALDPVSRSIVLWGID